MKAARPKGPKPSVGRSRACAEEDACYRRSRAESIKPGGLSVVFTLLLCFACGRRSEAIRPAEVPVDATYVTGGKAGGWWQQCTVSKTTEAAHCRIWNGAGLILENEDFLPYDGGAPPAADDLKVSPDPTFPGPDRIFLTNGRVLLPSSRFNDLKKFVDWLNGNASQPR
jgi:hypothetical protein